MAKASEAAEGVAQAFYIFACGMVLAALLGLGLWKFVETGSRELRLEQERKVHSIEPPGKGLNYRDPAAQKELQERGIGLP